MTLTPDQDANVTLAIELMYLQLWFTLQSHLRIRLYSLLYRGLKHAARGPDPAHHIISCGPIQEA